MLRQIRIGTRLIGAFLFIAAITAIVGGVGYWGLGYIAGDVHEIGEVRLPSVQSLLEMDSAANGVVICNRTMLDRSLSKADMDKTYAQLDAFWKKIDEAWKVYEPLPRTAEEAKVWKEFVPAFDKWRGRVGDYRKMCQKMDAMGAADADALAELQLQARTFALGDVYQARLQVSQLLNELVKINDEASELAVKDSLATAQFLEWTTLVVVSAGVLLAIALGVFMTRAITQPIALMVERLKDIAQGEGDLTKRVDQDAKDEVGQLGQWFNAFVQKVHDIISEVALTTRDVASAATEIAASSEQMASGMKEQSQQVTQISSAIEEMSQSVVEVARKSAEAAGNAVEAGKVAQQGGQVVTDTIAGMEAISNAVNQGAQSVTELGKRSEQIGQIVNVINDIADQTNLLALNAAIEAARAGEHGRGFAVVADEVRKLADRTTKATEEIAQSIRAIQTETGEAVDRMNTGTQQVKVGVDKATAAGQNLSSIVTAAQGVADMIRSIAAAAEEQSAASEQISRNVESVTAVTKQATEGAGQAAQAATQLSDKSEQLQRIVSQFKLASRQHKAA
ncbi:MAG: methyl-accepting chemotaxis protein [Phycisphaerales bacterium]|nr:methyl-accepting chemotaxis protein [Phycisphaerales bacterium]